MVPAARPAASCPNPKMRAMGDAGTATVRFSSFFFFALTECKVLVTRSSFAPSIAAADDVEDDDVVDDGVG